VVKNGSFDFAEGLIMCIGAKANVPFVRWVFIFSFSLCSKNFFVIISYVSLSFSNERQRWQYENVGHFETQNFQFTTPFIYC